MRISRRELSVARSRRLERKLHAASARAITLERRDAAA